MRPPRLKLSVAGLMTLIAGIALGIWIDRAYNKYHLCMDRAAHYKAQADRSRKNATDIETRIEQYRDEGHIVANMKKLERFIKTSRSAAEHADSFRSQCLRAAYLPFAPLPYDPAFDEPLEWEVEPPVVIPVPTSTAEQ